MTDRRDIAAYTVAEAARYAGVPQATLRSWLVPRGGLIVPADPPAGLSFWNFAEAWILSSIRKDHGIPMQRIRQAVDFVTSQLGVERPLIQAKFKSNGLDLFVDHLDGTMQASGTHQGQGVLKDLVSMYLSRVEYDGGQASSIYPFVRSFKSIDNEHPRAVVISPNFGFGRPVLAGTGIRTDVVASRYKAGESMSALAKDYALNAEQIEDAVRAEMREAS